MASACDVAEHFLPAAVGGDLVVRMAMLAGSLLRQRSRGEGRRGSSGCRLYRRSAYTGSLLTLLC